jgi:hypothetical protein
MTLTYAQSPDTVWTRIHGGENDDLGYSVLQTTDGGYVITGKTMSTFGRFWDVFLLKTDARGDTLWVKTYGCPYDDVATSVQQTKDGGYIIAGSSQPLGLGYVKMYLIKTDAKGDTIWTKMLGQTENDAAYCVEQTTDNGYILAGYAFSWATGGPDVCFIKTDSRGDTLWTKTFGGIYDDMAFAIQQTSDGGYVAVGFKGEPRNHDVYLLKTDAEGDTLWTKSYGGEYDDVGSSVQQTRDGGYIIAGHTQSFNEGGDPDVYLLKTDAKGNIIWAKTYGGTDYDVGYKVLQTSDGGFIVVGYSGPELVPGQLAGFDVYVLKTNGDGDELWSKTFKRPGADAGLDIKQTRDGGFIIVGQTNLTGFGNANIYLLKLEPE